MVKSFCRVPARPGSRYRDMAHLRRSKILIGGIALLDRGRPPASWYLGIMSPLHGRVQNGRIIVQEHVDLPEGTEVRLEIVEHEEDRDGLDDQDRARLEAAMDED